MPCAHGPLRPRTPRARTADESPSTLTGRRPNRAPARASPWSQFWSHSPPFTAVHRCPRPLVRAGHGRWRTVMNGGAQYSKACEGASLPWVQIPPPPPLTCTNSRPGGDRRVPHAPRGLICWSQFRAAEGYTVGISYGCCSWSQRPRTGLNAGERRYARRRGVRRTVQGWPGRSATGRRPSTRRPRHISDREVIGERAPSRRYLYRWLGRLRCS